MSPVQKIHPRHSANVFNNRMEKATDFELIRLFRGISTVQVQSRLERCTVLYCHVRALHLSVSQTCLCLISKMKIRPKLIKPTEFSGWWRSLSIFSWILMKMNSLVMWVVSTRSSRCQKKGLSFLTKQYQADLSNMWPVKHLKQFNLISFGRMKIC